MDNRFYHLPFATFLPVAPDDVAFNHVHQSIQPFIGCPYLLIMNLCNGKERINAVRRPINFVG